MKKVLILVLSYDEGPYRELMQAQQRTWHAVKNENVETLFYTGGLPKVYPSGVVRWESGHLQFDAPDDYLMMHWKFKLALDYAFDFEKHWDLIFRTNSSSYVNKKRLVEFAQNLPTEKLYAGNCMVDSNHDGGLCVSGAGIWLSRDTANILQNELKNQFECEEDVLIGRILRGTGIRAQEDYSRVDYPENRDQWESAYHVRFKTHDRRSDVRNMINFHKRISRFNHARN